MLAKLLAPTDSKESLKKLIEKEKLQLITERAKSPSAKYQALVEKLKEFDSSPSPTGNESDEISHHGRSSNSLKIGFLLKSQKGATPVLEVPPATHTSGRMAYGYSPPKENYMPIMPIMPTTPIMTIIHESCSPKNQGSMPESQASSLADDNQEEFSFSAVFSY